MVEVYEKLPVNFSPQVEVVAGYVEVENKLLLMQQSSRKIEPGKWGVPAGKIEPNEDLKLAMVRELFEETGLALHTSEVEYIGNLYIRRPTIEYIYHVFRVQLSDAQEIKMSDEHTSYEWVDFDNVCNLPLMMGAAQALHWYRSLIKKSGQ